MGEQIVRAVASVKDGILTIQVPFDGKGKVTASRKNVLHASTEAGTPDALSIQVDGKRVFVQVNAWSVRVPRAATPEKPAVKQEKILETTKQGTK